MIHGKGAQYNPANPFAKQSLDLSSEDGIDEDISGDKPQTALFFESTKNVLSRNTSEDIGFEYSINPYQGCEHGCVYCYARNSHTYWGFSAGLDFESKIIVKQDVAEKFEQKILSKNWKVTPIMLSGNTDCYQPLEKRFELTRSILKVALKYRHPMNILTKNALVLRDIDLLTELASFGLVGVALSITSADEEVRRKLEPRTSTYQNRLKVVSQLSEAGIPVFVMNAPIIPSINDHEIPTIIADCAAAGALDMSYTVVRLNGQIDQIFTDWIRKAFPERAEKVVSQIKELHGGQLNDSEWKRRMRGAGTYANMIHDLFTRSKLRHFQGRGMPKLRTDLFRRGGNYTLF